MSAIKRFFEKKKLNSKFKLAGAGHALNAPSSDKQVSTPSGPIQRCPSSKAGSHAANAALARFQAQQSQESKKPSSSATSWKQKPDSMPTSSKTEESNKIHPISPYNVQMEGSTIVSDCIRFCCPVCPVSLPREEIFVHLKQCLVNDLESEPLMISITMIHTLNQDKKKIENCIRVLSRYLQNIIDNPDEEKYRKIRRTNKVIQDKVANIEGAEEFLIKGCGFELQTLPYEDAEETTVHTFYVMNNSLAYDTEQLLTAMQMLTDAEPLDIGIERNVKVYEPSISVTKIEVPQSFYEIGAEEIKQNQCEITAEVEKSKLLRTKEMRKGDSAPKKKYRYCIIRIRLPDGFILQGTFSSSEKLIDLKKFVQQCLSMEWIPFSIVDSIGRPILDESATLAKLELCPSSIVNLIVEPNIAQEIEAASPSGKIQYLHNEYLALIQSLH